MGRVILCMGKTAKTPYLLKKIPTRVYGTHFTICLIENLLSENKMDIKNYKLFRINESDYFSILFF